MKSAATIFLLVVAPLFPHADATDEKGKSAPPLVTLRFGVDPNFKPYAYRDENGKLLGIEIDFVNALARRLQADVVYVEGQPEELKAKLARNELDVVLASIEPTFDLAYDFISTNYIRVPGVWITRGDDTQDKPPGKTKPVVGLVTQLVLRDELSQRAEKLKLGRIRGYESLDTILLALKRREIDAIPFEAIQGKLLVEHDAKALRSMPMHDLGIPLAALIRKDATGTVAEIPKQLAELIKDGTSQKICKSWFGDQCPNQ